jgi:hypothetical protein
MKSIPASEVRKYCELEGTISELIGALRDDRRLPGFFPFIRARSTPIGTQPGES